MAGVIWVSALLMVPRLFVSEKSGQFKLLNWNVRCLFLTIWHLYGITHKPSSFDLHKNEEPVDKIVHFFFSQLGGLNLLRSCRPLMASEVLFVQSVSIYFMPQSFNSKIV